MINILNKFRGSLLKHLEFTSEVCSSHRPNVENS